MGSLAKRVPGIWDGAAGPQDGYMDQVMRAGKAQFQEHYKEQQPAEAKQIQENNKEPAEAGEDPKAFQYNGETRYQPGADLCKKCGTANHSQRPGTAGTR